MNLFGFSIKRVADEQPTESFAPPQNDDGAAVINSAGYGGSYGTVVDLDGTIRGEADLITRYRQMSQHAEVLAAIDEIVNESIIEDDDGGQVVQLKLDELEDVLPPSLREAFSQEFDEILRLLEFNVNAYDVFKRWYVDGRLYYHIIIDKKQPALGIRELRYIDPRKIKKVKEVRRVRSKNERAAVQVQQIAAEYYVFNEQGFDSMKASASSYNVNSTNVGLKIAKDAILYCTSGLLDEKGQMVLSHLHQAMRPLNMLRTMEDSAVIYRLVRAPERRVWYIDVGQLPKMKAEQVVYDMMTRHKNKMVYDPATGGLKDQRKHVTMLEDIWLSRREGNKGTEVDVLPGSQNLGQMEEVDYFLKKLYKSLNVPISRLQPEEIAGLNRPGEITKSEVNFAKFVKRLRNRFSELFLDLLEKQLILKGYLSPEEWETIRYKIDFKFATDSYWDELKEQEILQQRMSIVQQAMMFTGRYVSNKWVRQTILKQTDEEMEDMDMEIMEERMNPLYMVQTDLEGNPISAGPGMSAPPPLPADATGNSRDK